MVIKTPRIRALATVSVLVIVLNQFTGYFAGGNMQPEMVASPAAPDGESGGVRTVSFESSPPLRENAVIIYEYYYEDGERTERSEEPAPAILIDAVRHEVELYFDDWVLVSFTPAEVLLRKIIPFAECESDPS